MSDTFSIKWGSKLHAYPCLPHRANQLRQMYRQQRRMFQHSSLSVSWQREAARDYVAHFLLVMTAGQS